MQDVRFALRRLRKNPGFTAVAILTLALGIGANTAIFSVINAVLLRPLPYPDPDQLAQLRLDRPGSPSTTVGSPLFNAIHAQSQSLSRIAAYCGGDLNLTGAGTAERLVAGSVSAGFFPLLGVQPTFGRNFTPEEDTLGGPRAVILSHGLWQSRFGGAPDLVGRAITLNEQSYTVVGLLPPHFRYPEPFQLWIPLGLDESGTKAGSPLAGYGEGMIRLKAIARLKPGVSLSQAQSELRTIAERAQPPQQPRPPAAGPAGSPAPGNNRGERVLTLVSLHEQVVGNVKGMLLVLLGAVAFVLLIACANVANLLLARAAARHREMAVRSALGASRWRIARELLTESVLLSLFGGALGLILAFWAVKALGQWNDAGTAALQGIRIDGWVLAFTLGVTALTGVAFGLAPALAACRADVNTALKEEGRSESAGQRSRLRPILVVSEVALALILLVGASLLLKSFSRLMDVNPGFQTRGVLTFQVALEHGRNASQRAAFVEQVVGRLQALPGVEAAAATDSLPLTQPSRLSAVEIEGRPPIDWQRVKPGEVTPVSRPVVTPDYFAAMGVTVKSGRLFTAQEARSASGPLIVNEAFEKHHFPGESAVGHRIRLRAGRTGSGPGWQTVVGVIRDVRQSGLAGEVMPEVYSPALSDVGTDLSFVVRVAGDPAALTALVRGVVAETEPNQPLYNVMTMEERLAGTTTSRRLNTALLGTFAAVALLLAVVGIYGVMSYSVAQRRREIGVRMALGAQRHEVLGLILNGGLRLTLLGVVIGVAGAFALTRYLSSQLYAVQVTDPVTFLIAPALLFLAGLAACWLPALRATRVDPMVALRND